MRKRMKNDKGFTLAELLIVVAIIAVLVAVSIPIFTSQLEKAREATDVANFRAAKAAFIVAVLDETITSEKAGKTFYYHADTGVINQDQPSPYGEGTTSDPTNSGLSLEDGTGGNVGNESIYPQPYNALTSYTDAVIAGSISSSGKNLNIDWVDESGKSKGGMGYQVLLSDISFNNPGPVENESGQSVGKD